MDRQDPIEKFKLSLYLLPVFGIIPSILTLKDRDANPYCKQISRTSLGMALAWAIVYFSCWQGANWAGDATSLRLLYGNALSTTGYFAACMWLALKIWQGRSI